MDEQTTLAQDHWHLIADQIIARDSLHIAMAITPQWARELVKMLNAQDAGAITAKARGARRLKDLQEACRGCSKAVRGRWW